MNKIISLFAYCLLIQSLNSYAQPISFDKNNLEAVGVSYSIEKLNDKTVLKVIKDSTVSDSDQPTFVKIRGIDLIDCTVELKVLSRLLKNAPESSRGFIGLAFRVNDSNSKFECIYLRPTNGRADDQLRRNHAIQYFSFPGYDFGRFRKEAPGQYESYADMGLDEWIKMRIEVKGNRARLFLNDAQQPALIVNDLKHGENASGTIGLWVDVGTEGYFADLKIDK